MELDDVRGVAVLQETLTFHDPCYLGRHNDIYHAPRKVIGQLKGIDIVEAPRNGTKGMCCGAGGGRMWMEESIGTKVNDERAREAISTGVAAQRDALKHLLEEKSTDLVYSNLWVRDLNGSAVRLR